MHSASRAAVSVRARQNPEAVARLEKGWERILDADIRRQMPLHPRGAYFCISVRRWPEEPTFLVEFTEYCIRYARDHADVSYSHVYEHVDAMVFVVRKVSE